MNKRQCLCCIAPMPWRVVGPQHPRLAATWCLQINHIAVRGGRGSPGGVLWWINDARLRYTKRSVARVKSDCSLLCCHESTRTESTLQWQSIVDWVVTFDCTDRSVQNILQPSRDYRAIMPKLRSTYDGRLIHETSYDYRNMHDTTLENITMNNYVVLR